MDDKPPTQDFHVILAFYISEHKRGFWRHIHNWAHQGGDATDPEAPKKAAECTSMLKSLEEPNELPGDPNQIVVVKYVDGDKTIIKKFPLNSVPFEIYQVLMVITDSRDEAFRGRLRFR
jgi:hypothetical protein